MDGGLIGMDWAGLDSGGIGWAERCALVSRKVFAASSSASHILIHIHIPIPNWVSFAVVETQTNKQTSYQQGFNKSKVLKVIQNTAKGEGVG